MNKEKIGKWLSMLMALIMIFVGGGWEPFLAASLVITALGENKSYF